MEALASDLPVLFQLWVFCVGAVVGSFLNVVIARVPKGESIVSPGSRCPRCGKEIAWYDNLPIASWLILRARCRNCGQPISARYPVVELLAGVLAVAIVRQAGPTWVALGFFALTSALVALAYIDLDTWLLPHQITWPLLAAGLASPLWNRSLTWLSSAIGAAAGFAFFAIIALFGEKVLKRETMGWGDVWLLSAIGAWLGWQALFPVIMLSALQGSIIGIVMLLVAPREPAPQEAEKEKESESDADWVPPRHAVPYGPFLALAALEHLLAGNRLAAVWDFFLRRLFG
jgi:leader peptidase (prepilin peptidase)/N-methyltransferase